MSKWAIWGIVLVVSGGVLLAFERISRLMELSESKWESMALVDLLAPER
ncbi:MAG: hypothetical protein JRH15_19315, partial [Deltaproteobacteria bacterium]|nr:hypothetical protein [Deltaproteobacteria bacterium]